MDESDLQRLIDGIFAEAVVDSAYSCGFDPNDENVESKAAIDAMRSRILRGLFLSDVFIQTVNKVATEALHADLSARWAAGELISGADLHEMRHFITHVARDIQERFALQAVEPFIQRLISEDRYCKSGAQDFDAAFEPPKER